MKRTVQPVPINPLSPLGSTSATQRFRRECWAELQRALDPLGQPRPLRSSTHPMLGDA